MGDKKGADHSGEVFRQFAWHLAGTLARPVRRAAKPRPAAAVKR